jgi:hypothetical protein
MGEEFKKFEELQEFKEDAVSHRCRGNAEMTVN